MVLSALLEFPASALTYVGNYAGPCYIHLNGEAIVVRYESGEVINKWPYNCIRQFRAEDETGKFSFVSGRRGPYGVAEYNFKLPNDSLNLLQSALTNFTGAQFSSVTPGSGSGADPPQPQPHPQPHPQFPPMRQAYSVSSAYHTDSSRTVNGRSESISSSTSSSDVFTSPVHHGHQLPIPVPGSSSPAVPPRLPPRDYSTTSLPGLPGNSASSSETHCHTQSMDDTMMRLMMKTRSGTNSSTASSLSNTSQEAGYSVTPPSLPPRRSLKECSPETRVAQSSSYNEVSLQQTRNSKLAKAATVDVLKVTPSTPPAKKLVNRLREVSGSSLAVPVAEVETVEEEEKEDQDKQKYVRNISETSESSLDVTNSTRSTASSEQPLTRRPKTSPYDHLPMAKRDTAEKPAPEATELENSRPYSTSPEINLPNFPEDMKDQLVEKESGLRRSSPTITARSGDVKLIGNKMEEGYNRRTLTTCRVSSDERAKPSGKRDPRKVQSVRARVNKPRPQVPMGGDSETYQVPRSSQYDNEGSNLDFTLSSNKKSSISPYEATDIYNVPRPAEQQPNKEDAGRENIYKVPAKTQPSHQVNGHAQDNYNVPRAVMNNSETEGVYSSPRRSEEAPGSNYDVPRNVQSATPPRFSRSSSGKENSIQNSSEEVSNVDLPPLVGRMRPTRSFESLHRMRVNTTALDGSPRANDRAHPKSPPVGVYIDIDLNKPIPPAKNAPLPPLPQLPDTGLPIIPKRKMDSMYCEISEKVIEKNRSQLRKGLEVFPQGMSPIEKSRSMTVTPSSSSSSQGIAKAKELSEEEGYEFFGPAGSIRFSSSSKQGSVPVNMKIGSTSASHGSDGISTRQTRLSSDGDGTHTTDLDPSVLGSSTPANDGMLTDEYIIVTGADRRPKNVSGPRLAPTVGDEYEVMTSARADNIVQRQLQRAQFPTQLPPPLHPSQYATPDPSLYSRPTSNAPATSSVPLPSQSTVKTQAPASPPRAEVEESVMAGISVEDMSPCDDQPTYGNVLRNWEKPSASRSSSTSDGNDDASTPGDDAASGEGVSGSNGAIPVARGTEMVKTLAGSPLNAVESGKLKSQTKSLGNILEESHYQVPPRRTQKTPPTTPPTSPRPNPRNAPSPVVGTTSTAKKHEYVNHIIEDVLRPSTPESKLSPSIKHKRRPQPLPRTSSLQSQI